MATGVSGEEQYQQQPKWTPFLTKLDQVLKGNRVNNSFPNKAWNFIYYEFYRKSGLKWDKEHHKNIFALVNLLLARDDFIFDESTGSVITTAQAWDQCVKEYPDAEAIRTSGCPIYKQLSLIFDEDSMTNGKYETMLTCYGHLEETKAEWSSEYDDVAAVVGSTPKRRRRGRGVEAAIANAIFEMAAASKLRTTALNQLKSRFSLSECIKSTSQHSRECLFCIT